ncbi:PAS domain S-box-containing protein/diguanylate cyclase (GGDEF)-like protein [Nitrosospira sp. Nsp5]|uniref:PAS domain S-box-containing protein/diguanylate cyclase (GGDEF) domain-containing protein n=1 Tax=Nitrosospira multiformis TaxID=1231 RepID=A0ABY0TD71_9PROT|nr:MULTISPECIES: EAL domain-containing protein [Nitrosospira]PTR06186.1 PAS domain S-box-containing protein/diguanylate cyclase (GGDEF)-like protein [Nitrosospira sp. Nsp5]SDQ65227.1 PAS domain S-box-containing protein/diguanylate cyclase (GGDEF) domain-containing protein [Nitrosospira multiformis]
MRRPPWVIILLYAALSILWLGVAGYLISLTVDDPVLRGRAYVARELMLVVMSSGLFYLLLKLGRERTDAASLEASSDSDYFWSNRLLFIFAALASVAPLVSIGIIKVYGPEMERKAYADLQTIVDLKAEQVELWLTERHRDAEAIAVSQALIERVANTQKKIDAHLHQLIRNRLEAVQKAYSYESVLLLDTEGQLLLTPGEKYELPAVTKALLPAALETKRIQSSDLFLDERGIARLDIIVPLVPQAISQQAIAVVVLRANLGRFLLPLVGKWPVNSLSAETLLVRQQGETIAYLNSWRHLKNPAQQAADRDRQSVIASKDVPAAAAAREQHAGTSSGIDYRGELVLAAFRPMTGTGWHLLSKIDRSEVLAHLWTLVFWVSMAILLAIAAVSGAVWLLWRQQRRAHQLALLVHTAEQDKLLKYFYELPFIGMAITSPDSKRWLRFNDRLCEILGYSREELAVKNWVEMTHPDDIEKDIVEFEKVIRGESEGYTMNKRYIRKDGSIVIANISVKCVRTNDGKVNYFVAMIRDITEQEHRKTEALAAQSQLKATLDAIPDLLFELDLNGRCHDYHSARTDLPTAPVEDLLGKKISDILPSAAVDIIASALLEAQEKGLSSGKQLELEFAQGKLWFELSVSRKHVDSGHDPRFIVLARDITERKASEQRILNLAHYDSLTGLPNRALLADRMRVAIKYAERQSTRLAVLFVDLDRFKPINDSLGHDIGDQLLKAAAQRMQMSVRSVDTVSRVGGDEFVVLLSQIGTTEDAARVADKLITGLSQPYGVEGHELQVTASVGICIYPDNGTQPNVLLRNADASMYSAKEGGRNRYQFYSEDMTVRAIERLSLEHDLRGAAQRGEIFMVYQPQIELATNRIIGAEVLMRWRHPTQGLIAPARFIPIAEDSGLILVIGEWILVEACRQAQQWRDRGLLDASVSVNVSAIQFRQNDFVRVVERAINLSGISPDCLELELTESVVMQGIDSTEQKLQELDALGVKVAIDDFGTGYSSLSYLQQFTVDRLKIDQSFVRDLPGNIDAAAIATAIVAMGLSLGLRIIAEGVETEAQAEFLQSVLCKEGQGYLYARPMEADEFEAWVAAWEQQVKNKS